jgi:hypothetical protein
VLPKNLKIKIYSTISLPVVLYGCETWLLTSREECRLRVFEKRVLKRIFGPKRDEVTGEWKKLQNEKLNDLYSSPNTFLGDKIKNGMGGACSTYGGRREAYTGFWWGNLEERGHVGEPGIYGRIILRQIFGKWNVGI